MKPFFDLLTGRAFRPDPLDVAVPFLRRMRGRTVVALSGMVGNSIALTEMKLTKIVVKDDGSYELGTPELFTAKSADAQVSNLMNFADRCDTRYVAVSMGDAFMVQISEKAPPMGDIETLNVCRTNPGKVIGIPKENERVYCVVRHPKLKTVLVFSLVRKRVMETCDVVTKANLDLVRLQCGTAAICAYLVDVKPGVIAGESDLLIVDGLQVFHLFSDKGDWVKAPLNIPPNPNQDFVTGIRAHFSRALPARMGMKLSVVNAGKTDLMPFFQQNYPNLQVEDLFRDAAQLREVDLATGLKAQMSLIDLLALIHN